jgi:hypothetical protein
MAVSVPGRQLAAYVLAEKEETRNNNNMQQERFESFIQQLCDAQTQAGKKAWSQFFCEVPLVEAVTATFTLVQAAGIWNKTSQF